MHYTIKQLSVGLILLSSVFVFLTTCSSGNQDSSTMQETKQKTQQKKAIYYCPMKCEGDKAYNKPGKCPECGMKLKKKEK